MALPLGENRHQHVGSGDFIATGGLDMNDRPLNDPLEPGGRLRVLPIVGNEIGKLVVDVILEIVPQYVEIDAAGTHHGSSILVVDKREEEMFQGCIFMAAFIGDGERTMKRLLETA